MPKRSLPSSLGKLSESCPSAALAYVEPMKLLPSKVDVYLRDRDQIKAVKLLSKLRSKACPFPHIPYRKAGDIWSAGLTEDERTQFVWLSPVLKARVKFLEITKAGHLRHAQFVGFVP